MTSHGRGGGGSVTPTPWESSTKARPCRRAPRNSSSECAHSAAAQGVRGSSVSRGIEHEQLHQYSANVRVRQQLSMAACMFTRRCVCMLMSRVFWRYRAHEPARCRPGVSSGMAASSRGSSGMSKGTPRPPKKTHAPATAWARTAASGCARDGRLRTATFQGEGGCR